MATEALIENLIVPWDRCPCQPSWLSSLAEVDLCKACFSTWPKVFGSLCRRKIWSIYQFSKGFESPLVWLGGVMSKTVASLSPVGFIGGSSSLGSSVRKGTEKLSWPKSSLETNELLGVNGPSQFSIEMTRNFRVITESMNAGSSPSTPLFFTYFCSFLTRKRLERLQRQQRSEGGGEPVGFLCCPVFFCLNHTTSIIFEGKLQVVFEVWGLNLWKLWICQTKILCHPHTEHISKATQIQLASFIQLGEKFLHIPKICQSIRRKVSRDLRAHTGLEPSKMERTASCPNPCRYDAPDFKPHNSLEIREFLVRRNHGQSSQELVGFWMVWKWSLWVVGRCYSGKLRG